MTQSNQPNLTLRKQQLTFVICFLLMIPLILFIQISKAISSTVSEATSFHQLKCTHSEGFCEVLQFKVLQFDYVVTEKIDTEKVSLEHIVSAPLALKLLLLKSATHCFSCLQTLQVYRTHMEILSILLLHLPGRHCHRKYFLVILFW